MLGSTSLRRTRFFSIADRTPVVNPFTARAAIRTFARMSTPIIAVRAPFDAVLHHIAPLGAATAAGTALVVDLDGAPTGYRGETLADLAADGVRRRHLAPDRSGVAVLGRGAIDHAGAMALLDRLTPGWPAVVVRCSSDDCIPNVPGVTVRVPLPGSVGGRTPDLVVWQRLSAAQQVPGMSLPPPGRRRVVHMLDGRVDPRWRWVKAWREVWEEAWD
jgi:hypothetical protein